MSEPVSNSISIASIDESLASSENFLRKQWNTFRAWLLCTQQKKLIFPGSKTQGLPVSRISERDGTQLLRLNAADGTAIRALYGDSKISDPDSVPYVLFFYGNDTSLSISADLFDHLRNCDANVLIPEYVGYGMSDGQPTESNCYATADAAYDWLVNEKKVDPSRLIVMGASLGGAVAIDLASRKKVAGLITVVTFTSLADVGEHHWPAWPVRRFLKHHFHSEEKIVRVTCPALIVHSSDDVLIPHEQADRLAAAAGSEVRRFSFSCPQHDGSALVTAGGAKLLAEIRDFLRRVVAH